jgi:hypothetical protein
MTAIPILAMRLQRLRPVGRQDQRTGEQAMQRERLKLPHARSLQLGKLLGGNSENWKYVVDRGLLYLIAHDLAHIESGDDTSARIPYPDRNPARIVFVLLTNKRPSRLLRFDDFSSQLIWASNRMGGVSVQLEPLNVSVKFLVAK